MEENKVKKPIFKKWWFWLIVVVVVVAIAGGTGGGNKNAAPAGAQSSAKPSATPAPTKTPAPDTTITLAEFNNINTGMTYKEAVAVIGCEGTVTSQSEIAGIKITLYTWKGSGDIGANANASFQNDKLVSKAQFGLK